MTRREAIAAAAVTIDAADGATRTTALMADPVSKLHDTGPSHPECPQRFDVVMTALADAGIPPKTLRVPSREATDDEIAACHTRGYIATAKSDIANDRGQLSTGDTAISKRSLEVALKAAGGVLNAVDAVMAGKAKNAFCVVRPPGHHATPGKGMGFCVFNNIAIAARYAQKKHGAGRVMIADWDVHHGNGTQDIFYTDGSVLFFSTHQSPWYPGTGAASERGEDLGYGKIVNCPFGAGAGHAEIGGAFRERLLPAAAEFKPDLVLISAGFDSRIGDPLGRFRLTDADFGELTRMMMDVADKHAQGRLVSVLEGGYNLEGAGQGAAAHVAELLKG